MAYILIWVRLRHLPLRLSVQEPTVRVLGIYAKSHIVFPSSLVFSLFSFLFLFSIYYSSFSVLLFVLFFSVPLFLFLRWMVFLLFFCITVCSLFLGTSVLYFCVYVLFLCPLFVHHRSYHFPFFNIILYFLFSTVPSSHFCFLGTPCSYFVDGTKQLSSSRIIRRKPVLRSKAPISFIKRTPCPPVQSLSPLPLLRLSRKNHHRE